jgi:hypothetical protein
MGSEVRSANAGVHTVGQGVTIQDDYVRPLGSKLLATPDRPRATALGTNTINTEVGYTGGPLGIADDAIVVVKDSLGISGDEMLPAPNSSSNGNYRPNTLNDGPDSANDRTPPIHCATHQRNEKPSNDHLQVRDGHEAPRAAVKRSHTRPRILGIRQTPDNGEFRVIFRERDDAVIVDAKVKGITRDGLYVVDGGNPTLRIRDGFSPIIAKKLNPVPPTELSLKPVKLATRVDRKDNIDFLTAHEARMRRIAALNQSLVGLLGISISRAAPGPDGSHRAMGLQGFPVRPPPPCTRACLGKASNPSEIRPHPPGYEPPPLLSARPNRPKLVRPFPQPRRNHPNVPRSVSGELASAVLVSPRAGFDRV